MSTLLHNDSMCKFKPNGSYLLQIWGCYKLMRQHIARCFMFKHESGEVCVERGVETCQALKNACIRDLDLPVGASELNMMNDIHPC